MSIVDKSFINNLPEREDFFIKYNQIDLDIDYAIEKYLGRDLEYVKKYFCPKSCSGVLDDIRYIGGIAFSYYIIAIFQYIMELKLDSDERIDVYDALCSLPDIIEEKIIKNKKQIKKIFKYIFCFSKWVIEHEKYIHKDHLFCDDLKHRYERLQHMLK